MSRWAERFGAFAREFKEQCLDPEALAFLRSLPLHQPVLAACSGGADSLFLVLALRACLPGAAGRLRVVHFNHRVRGQAAEADAAFVAELADELDLPYACGWPEAPLSADEGSLRTARYRWLQTQYHEVQAGALCLGHHADDLLETQWMALFGGSGPAGLASPLPVRTFPDGHVRVRPLLVLKRREIEARLRALEIPWQTDSSNIDPRHTRNWIRQTLLPLATERFGDRLYAGSTRTRLQMEESLAALDAAVQALPLDLESRDVLPAAVLRGQPRAVVRRALMSWWLRHHADLRLEKPLLEALIDRLQAGQPGGPLSVGQGLLVSIDPTGYLSLYREPTIYLSLPRGAPTGLCWHWASGPAFLPDGGALSAERVEWDSSVSPPYLRADPAREAWLAVSDAILRIDPWQAGDRYRPLGAPGRRKLQDLFVDAKISPEQKRSRPVLKRMEGTILWVPGFPPAEDARLLPPAKSALKLTYLL